MSANLVSKIAWHEVGMKLNHKWLLALLTWRIEDVWLLWTSLKTAPPPPSDANVAVIKETTIVMFHGIIADVQWGFQGPLPDLLQEPIIACVHPMNLNLQLWLYSCLKKKPGLHQSCSEIRLWGHHWSCAKCQMMHPKYCNSLRFG